MLIYAQPKQTLNAFCIKASLANWDSTFVSVTAQGDTLHQDTVRHGVFQFAGYTEEIKEAVFIIKKGGLTIRLPFYLETGEIHIQGHERNTIDFDITGTYHNNLLSGFYKQLNATHPFANAATEEEYQKNRRLYVQEYIQNHKSSLLTLVLYRQYILDAETSEQEKQGLFLAIKKSIRATYGGKEISKKLTQLLNTSVGKTAPLFSHPDTTNQLVSLQQFRGKYVLVDFWASWCIPCRKENPAIKKVYDEFKERGLVIISVSLDSDRERWLNAIRQDQLPWLHLSDLKGWDNAVAKQYSVQAIPANLLLDTKGIIINKNISGEALWAKLVVIMGKHEKN